MQAQASLMNSTNYTKAHEAKNRGQHIQAAGYLKMAAIDLGLVLDWNLNWTEDAMADWDNNIAAVDAAWKHADFPSQKEARESLKSLLGVS